MPERLNRPPPMGWPWDQLADATLRWADARDRHHAAQVALATAAATDHEGNPAWSAAEVRRAAINDRERAALDMEQALLDHWEARQEVSRQWLTGLRMTLELQPANLAELLRDVPPSEIVVQSLRELEDRTEAAEGQAAKAGRETWALANALADVIQGRQTGASGDERREAGTGEEPAPRETPQAQRRAG